jgi:hypothetical protein
VNGKEKAECSSTETAGSSSMPTETNNKSPSNYQPFKYRIHLAKLSKGQFDLCHSHLERDKLLSVALRNVLV